MLVGCDGDDRLLNEVRALLAGRRLEFAALRGLQGEQLLDAERLVGELRVGRHKGDAYAVPGEIAERQQRLQARDPAAGDQYAAWLFRGCFLFVCHPGRRGRA